MAAITRLIEDPAMQMDYMKYAVARYGDGLDTFLNAAGRRYTALTGNIPRMFKQTSKGPKVAPLPLIPILLSQSDDIDLTIHAEKAAVMAERQARRLEKWGNLGIPSAGQNLNFKTGVKLVDALEALDDSSLDELTIRFPGHWAKREMEGLSRVMLQKLNLDDPVQPDGANVLIGLKYRSGEKLAAVFEGVVGEQGCHITQSGNFAVGGERAPAKLLFIRRS